MHSHRILKIITLAFLFIPNAHAFDPPPHRQLTRISSEFTGLPLTEQEIVWMMDGASGEDEDSNLASQRANNWHFFPDTYYPKDTFIKPRTQGIHIPIKGTINYHAGTRINDIITKLDNAIKEVKNQGCDLNSIENRDSQCKLKNVFEYLGRGLHFVQDASVPSHAVPIYHGPYLPTSDLLAEFRKLYKGKVGLKIADPVDSAPVSSALQVHVPKDGGDSLINLIKFNLAEVLRITASPLAENDGFPFQGKTWNYFFQKPAPGSFFGEFGLDNDDNRLFDPETRQATVLIKDTNTNKISQAIVPERSVTNFFKKVHTLSVESGARFIRRSLKELGVSTTPKDVSLPALTASSEVDGEAKIQGGIGTNLNKHVKEIKINSNMKLTVFFEKDVKCLEADSHFQYFKVMQNGHELEFKKDSNGDETGFTCDENSISAQFVGIKVGKTYILQSTTAISNKSARVVVGDDAELGELQTY